MATKNQLTGMRGVYLAAAELTGRGFIVSPTSRSAQGADLLVAGQNCKKTFSVQVKTNATTFNFWLFSKKAKQIKAPSHLYILINLRKHESEFFIVPSRVVARNIHTSSGVWHSFSYQDALSHKDKWSLFGKPK